MPCVAFHCHFWFNQESGMFCVKAHCTAFSWQDQLWDSKKNYQNIDQTPNPKLRDTRQFTHLIRQSFRFQFNFNCWTVPGSTPWSSGSGSRSGGSLSLTGIIRRLQKESSSWSRRRVCATRFSLTMRWLRCAMRFWHAWANRLCMLLKSTGFVLLKWTGIILLKTGSTEQSGCARRGWAKCKNSIWRWCKGTVATKTKMWTAVCNSQISLQQTSATSHCCIVFLTLRRTPPKICAPFAPECLLFMHLMSGMIPSNP